MSRDDRQPTSDSDLELASDAIQELREAVRDDLVDDETGEALPDGRSD